MSSFINSLKMIKWYEWGLLILVFLFEMLKMALPNVISVLPVEYLLLNVASVFIGTLSVFGIILCSKGSIASNLLFIIYGSINLISSLLLATVGQRPVAYENKIQTLIPIISNFIIVIGSIISWIVWTKHRDENNRAIIKVRKFSPITSVITIQIILVVMLIIIIRNWALSIEGFIKIGENLEIVFQIILAITIVMQIFRFRERFIFSTLFYFFVIFGDIITTMMEWVIFVQRRYYYSLSEIVINLSLRLSDIIIGILFLAINAIGLYNWNKLQKERNPENK